MNCDGLPQLYNVSSSFNGDAYCTALSECIEVWGAHFDRRRIERFSNGFIEIKYCLMPINLLQTSHKFKIAV